MNTTFELFECNAVMAYNVIQQGKRKVVIKNGYFVKWINLNNDTCFVVDNLKKSTNGRTFNNEDVKFFILVPPNVKTVY